MNLDQYIKKHTFIFLTMLLIIIMILVYSFILVDNSDFSNRDIIMDNPLSISFKTPYISVTKSDDINDLSENIIYIYNPTNTKEKYNLYISSNDVYDLSSLVYSINGSEAENVSRDGKLISDYIDPNTNIELNIGFITTDYDNLPEFKIELK